MPTVTPGSRLSQMDWLGGGDGDAIMTGTLNRIRHPGGRAPNDGGTRSASDWAYKRRRSRLIVKVIEASGRPGGSNNR
jgi:hypothetical protein